MSQSACPPFPPRYLEFHPTLNVCYVVNELASSILVYRFDEYRVFEALHGLENADNPSFVPTLEIIQEIGTVPSGFPKTFNTCGRIAMDPSGRWVLVSNRGHDSIAVYEVRFEGEIGQLRNVG